MMDKEEIARLEGALNEAASGLRQVTQKKMFGCHALFANGSVFALVWKHGQIGVKLTEEKDYERLMAMKGAGPWKAGAMKMSHWVLVPEAVQKEVTKLVPWVRLAHKQALVAPAKSAGRKKSPSKKKPAKRAKA